MTTGQQDNERELTALEVATAVEKWFDDRYSDEPGLFKKLGGAVWTNVEARRKAWDLFTVDENVALVMIVEGVYEWSDMAAAKLRFRYPGWQVQPLTGYALAIYAWTES